jgi:ribosomal protein S18 acetylase RimI-like enzyme
MHHWSGAWTKERIENNIENNHVHVLEIKSKVVATVILNEDPASYYNGSEEVFWESRNARALYLSGLAVDPVTHNQGYGKSLMLYAETVAQQLQISFIRLDVIGPYKQLHKFYERNGFLPKGVMKQNYYQNILYEKKIGLTVSKY